MSTKTVWITGASSGIGREFARRYARLGFRLILTARRRDRLETLAAELRAKHGTLCRIVPADLEQDAQVTALCEALADERIDLFINNAGFGACGAFSETDAGKELSMLRVNVLAMEKGGPHIVVGGLDKAGDDDEQADDLSQPGDQRHRRLQKPLHAVGADLIEMV